MGTVQSDRIVRSGNPHLPAARPVAWIENPKMGSGNPALSESFGMALIQGIPGHEPPADRRSWTILEADFPGRPTPRPMNYSKRDRETPEDY
jgi:hypothetical protein